MLSIPTISYMEYVDIWIYLFVFFILLLQLWVFILYTYGYGLSVLRIYGSFMGLYPHCP